jgi:predicted 3-demethylubiquinone-9 3-methyltransferase (glyoxalase superfamily)
MQKVVPFLWFDDQAEEAVNLYTSVIKNAKVLFVSRYVEGSHKPVGSVQMVSFAIDGQEFVALNGGPEYQFTPAVSFLINCETQDEVDSLWEKLSAGGEKGQCGWIKDRFGVSWQIVPTALGELMSSGDAEQGRRVTQAMLQMKKLDIEGLRRAAYQK